MSILVAAVAGGAGAALRYTVSGYVQRGSRASFPTGTAAVNLAGALAVGLVAGLSDPGTVPFDISVGFLGGFTTFSTWMVESVALGFLPRVRATAVVNVLGTLIVGVCLAAVGYTLTS